MPRADHTPDLRGKDCLVPVVTVQADPDLPRPGSLPEVLAGSPATVRDLEVWARQTRHQVLASGRDGLWLRKPVAAGGARTGRSHAPAEGDGRCRGWP